MALKFSMDIRNARRDVIKDLIGTSPVLKIRTGAPPAAITGADSGTVLAEMSLPSDWADVSVDAVLSKLGAWQDLIADAGGDAGHFRIYESDGTTQKMQGTVTVAGGGGDMELESTITITAGHRVVLSSFALTEGN